MAAQSLGFRVNLVLIGTTLSGDDGIRVKYPEICNICMGCLRGVRKAVELDSVKFIVRSENLSWNWITGSCFLQVRQDSARLSRIMSSH